MYWKPGPHSISATHCCVEYAKPLDHDPSTRKRIDISSMVNDTRHNSEPIIALRSGVRGDFKRYRNYTSNADA